jgi:limonene 1,2-monooxygenase
VGLTTGPLKFGAFMAPYHFAGRNPTLHLRRDLDIITFMDELGYDEIFVGEHHSGGVEIVANPELFLAAAAQRTRNIRLGTGVVSVPYHHPFMLAERLVLLDHLSSGRLIFGVGPGASVTDAHMMGIDPNDVRHRLVEGYEAVMRLLNNDGPVTMKTDWFELNDVTLQLHPFQQPRMESAVAALRSPSGPQLAGKFGAGLISIAATDVASGGFDFLRDTWAIVEDSAREHSQPVDRSSWRLVGPMHLAETEELAREQVKWGLPNTMRVSANGPFNAGGKDVEDVLADTSLDEIIDKRNESGYCVIGTPEMAINQIHRLWKQAGGFGSFLIQITEMADYHATRRSLELFAEYVIPAFQPLAEAQSASWDALFANRRNHSRDFRKAQDLAIAEYEKNKQ